jgi:hypothetical protein
METGSLLSESILGALKGLLEHSVVVPFFIGLILVLVRSIRNRLVDLSGWFVPVSVHGNWDTTLFRDVREESKGVEPNIEPHEEATLHQFFNKVWGKTTKKETGVNFKVRGQIIGDKLAMVYRESRGVCSGAILLNIRRDQMEGYEVGRDFHDSDIYLRPYTWTRIQKHPRRVFTVERHSAG